MNVEGIDAGAVESWLLERTEVRLPLRFERIAGGLSNLTYEVVDAAGERFALRRPPLGGRQGSAHDVAREYRVITGLTGSGVPVPDLVGLCEDDTVNGAPFYVMRFVDGPVLRSPDDVARFFPRVEERLGIGFGTVDALAELHGLDPDAVGLGDLGRKDAYVERQLRRWSGQWEKGKTRDLPVVDEVFAKLSARIPIQGPATIVHGDFRLDNAILDYGGEVAAVVDWELCTLGDPLADLGLLLVYWAEPSDEFTGLTQPATTAPGFPSRAQVKDRYAERTGRDLANVDYYVALGYWKLAVILEGVYARLLSGQYGTTGDQEHDHYRRSVEGLADAAAELCADFPAPSR
jgi:aminoglycoside phosphotransferase (APT) family kinase protein